MTNWPVLTTHDISIFREEAERILTEECTILRRGTPVPDGMGGFEPGQDQEIGPIRCYKRMPRLGAETQMAETMKLVNPWIILFPAGTEVLGTDRIRVGDKVFDVAAVLDGGTREILRKVMTVEMTT